VTPEEFRKFGHEVVDWIADYSANIRDFPVLPAVEPGDLIAKLPADAPEEGESMEAILADFRRLIPPHMTHWNHPRFFAYFANSSTGPGILGEMLSAAMNANGMLWRSAPAVSELEEVTLDWLRQWLGLPEKLFGIIHDTASTATFHALVAARERAGGDHGDLTCYASEHAHSSVEKAALAAGIARENIRRVEADHDFRMRADRLEASIQADLTAGLRPFCVTACIGTTGMASVDPVPDITKIAVQHGLWLHVDAAYAGSAAIVSSMRHVLEGVEQADSFVVNPHKWMLAPMDLSVLYTRHPEAFRQAFSLIPEILRTPYDDAVNNRMDYGVPLGRRFRALKLWFIMRYYGRQRLAGILEGHMRMAAEFAEMVKRDERFELCAPVLFSLVCFRYQGTDDDNSRILEQVNGSGWFLSHTRIGGRKVLRLAIGNRATTIEDVRGAWDAIRRASAFELT